MQLDMFPENEMTICVDGKYCTGAQIFLRKETAWQAKVYVGAKTRGKFMPFGEEFPSREAALEYALRIVTEFNPGPEITKWAAQLR